MIRLITSGASGRTGSVLARLAIEAADIDPVVDISRVVMMGGPDQMASVKTLRDAPSADVIVDFTTPETCAAIAADASARKVALVTGTTGLDEVQQATLKDASKHIPVLQSGNFSLGVNMLLALVEKASHALSGFDIEIRETHHRRKIDSPSGTALMLGEAAARGQNTNLMERAVFNRHGQIGPRPDGEIGFCVTRGGGVIGDHAVSFLSESEVITLSHRAINRELFAQGALHAARWIVGKPAGLYTMQDVLAADI